jgi:hypothetical protein
MSAASAAVLLNAAAIAIDQDALGQMGSRLETADAPLQRWWRRLASGDVAVALLNRHGAPVPCPDWRVNHTGYLECCNGGCCEAFSNLTLAAAEAACCTLGADCAGSNLVRPTARTARFSSPLGVYDFQKRTSVIEVTARGADALGGIASVLARAEGLEAHARAAEYRLKPKRRGAA